MFNCVLVHEIVCVPGQVAVFYQFCVLFLYYVCTEICHKSVQKRYNTALYQCQQIQ